MVALPMEANILRAEAEMSWSFAPLLKKAWGWESSAQLHLGGVLSRAIPIEGIMMKTHLVCNSQWRPCFSLVSISWVEAGEPPNQALCPLGRYVREIPGTIGTLAFEPGNRARVWSTIGRYRHLDTI